MVFVTLTTTLLALGPDMTGFKKTATGLSYKFIVQNPKAQKVQLGDVLVAEIGMRLNADTLYSNFGDPKRILQVTEGIFNGDLPEGLLMLHIGDVATFAVNADSMAQYYEADQMPSTYVAGRGDKVFYDIHLIDIVTAEEIAQEEEMQDAEWQELKAQETADIAKYVADHHITVKPTESGLYVVINRKGDGPKVVDGKTVYVNYTGRLLDGRVFDSNIESVAKENNIYQKDRVYEEMKYIVGQVSFLPGWDEGIMGQSEGSIITLVMPSDLGRGEDGAGDLIPPYSPLVFEIEIVSVK